MALLIDHPASHVPMGTHVLFNQHPLPSLACVRVEPRAYDVTCGVIALTVIHEPSADLRRTFAPIILPSITG